MDDGLLTIDSPAHAGQKVSPLEISLSTLRFLFLFLSCRKQNIIQNQPVAWAVGV